MKLLTSAVVVIVIVCYTDALRIARPTTRPACRHTRDCDLVDCGDAGPKRDRYNCVLKDCPCKRGFTPPDNSCVCVRSPCPCPVSCPKLTCPVDCGSRNGWVLDEAGCNTCQCKPSVPVCPLIRCANECPFGRKTDRNGCQTCECKAPVCPLIRCANQCPSGTKKDRNGCNTCECNSLIPKCPLVLCAQPEKPCTNGFAVDSNGCSTCKCKEPICEPVLCEIACRYGFAKNSDGCEICKCNPPPVCKPVLCKLGCQNGFATDENGCEICRCKPTVCNPVLCRRFCPNGFVTDKNGCQTCQCKPICPQVLCKRPCPNGFVTDSNGCQTCQCKTDHICLPRPCAPRPGGCPNGFKKDEFGCDTCECACGPVCLIFCPLGNVPDEFGCPTCTCITAESPSWNAWGQWSSCSRTCGTGTRTRTRTCSDPSGDNELCPGSETQTRSCRLTRSCGGDGCPRFRCRRFCPTGYITNSRGCRTCTCKPNDRLQKPGTCPQLRQSITSSSRSGCTNDYDCTGTHKCCEKRPGFNVCIAPLRSRY